MRILLALALAACGSHAPAQSTLARLDPTAQLVDPASSTPFVPAERYRGRVVVLDFWASWCAQCRETVPQVSRLAEAFAAQGVVVLGVNAGDRASEAVAAAKQFGIAYPIALDLDLRFGDRLGASGLPTLLVFDRSGALVHRAKHVDEATLAAIRELLKAPAATNPIPPAAPPSGSDVASPLPVPPPP